MKSTRVGGGPLSGGVEGWGGFRGHEMSVRSLGVSFQKGEEKGAYRPVKTVASASFTGEGEGSPECGAKKKKKCGTYRVKES